MLIPVDAMSGYEPYAPPGPMVPTDPETVRLIDYVPSAEKRRNFENRMTFWKKKIIASTAVIDEEIWVTEFQNTDAVLGNFGEQALRILLECHREMLVKQPSRRSPERLVPQLKMQ